MARQLSAFGSTMIFISFGKSEEEPKNLEQRYLREWRIGIADDCSGGARGVDVWMPSEPWPWKWVSVVKATERELVDDRIVSPLPIEASSLLNPRAVPLQPKGVATYCTRHGNSSDRDVRPRLWEIILDNITIAMSALCTHTAKILQKFFNIIPNE